MTVAAIDADAVHCIRSYGLLKAAMAWFAERKGPIEPLLVCTGFVARHELNPLQREVAAWEAGGLLRVESILARSPASRRRRQLRQRHPGIDKGESELVAWILEEPPGTPFVSCDGRARSIARQEGLVTWDVLDLAHEWLSRQILTLSEVESCLVPWQDDPRARWCPRDFEGVEATLRKRYESDYLRPLTERRSPGG